MEARMSSTRGSPNITTDHSDESSSTPSWDSIGWPNSYDNPKDIQMDEEPDLSSPFYRRLWELTALTIFTVGALALWYFYGPTTFPWWLIVTAIFLYIWSTYDAFQEYQAPNQSSDSVKNLMFKLHVQYASITSVLCSLLWFFSEPSKPWFVFVIASCAFLLILHYTLSFVDLRRLWILPQVCIYLLATLTCFSGWRFYSPRDSQPWWIWPSIIWGLLIVIQLALFILVTSNRISRFRAKKAALTLASSPPSILLDNDLPHSMLSISPAASLRVASAEVPLLVDFDTGSGGPPSTEHRSIKIQGPAGTLRAIQPTFKSATMKSFKVHHGHAGLFNDDASPAARIGFEGIHNIESPTSDASIEDSAAIPLVEYFETPPGNTSKSQKIASHYRSRSSPSSASHPMHELTPSTPTSPDNDVYVVHIPTDSKKDRYLV